MTTVDDQDRKTRNGPFADRVAAGESLAQRLTDYRGRPDVVVLGLARGGVPVAAQVALALSAPLAVVVVRKVGMPGHEEFAMGAVGPDESLWLDSETIRRYRIPSLAVEQVVERERAELRRRISTYPATHPDVFGKTVILVDDGLATGASMHVAVAAMRNAQAGRVVVAVPVAASSAAAAFRNEADEVVTVVTPAYFQAVGQWYRDFSPTTDAQVRHWVAEVNR